MCVLCWYVKGYCLALNYKCLNLSRIMLSYTLFTPCSIFDMAYFTFWVKYRYYCFHYIIYGYLFWYLYPLLICVETHDKRASMLILHMSTAQRFESQQTDLLFIKFIPTDSNLRINLCYAYAAVKFNTLPSLSTRGTHTIKEPVFSLDRLE
jgi:hypothetical protein